MGQQQEKLNNYFNQVPKIQIKICLVRGKATLFDRIKIFWISAMADLQEIIKTHTKSYPSYLDTYPRNGKTTVMKTVYSFWRDFAPKFGQFLAISGGQCSRRKNKVTFVTEPQKIGKINVTLFTFILPTFRGSVMAFFTRPYFCNLSTLTTLTKLILSKQLH